MTRGVLASCGYIVGMLVGAAFAFYPTVLPASTDPSYSLTIYNTATGAHGMRVGLRVVGNRNGACGRLLRLRLPHVPRQGAVEEGASGHGY